MKKAWVVDEIDTWSIFPESQMLMKLKGEYFAEQSAPATFLLDKKSLVKLTPGVKRWIECLLL